jgi:hypothetical protein
MADASRWRGCLLGTVAQVEKLRSVKLSLPNIDEIENELEEINRDLRRTYPLISFFRQREKELRNILLWYSYTNVCVSYCQSFSYLSFILYKVFYEEDPAHAMIDVYYAMHKLLLVVRPLLPKNHKDATPLTYLSRLEELIFNQLVFHDKELFDAIKNTFLLKHLLLQGFSSFFLNWFSCSDGVRLIDYIIDNDVRVIFRRMVLFTVSFLMVNREYFLNFDELTCMDFVSRKNMFKFDSIFYKLSLLNLSNT